MAYAAIQNFPSNFRKEERKSSHFIPKTHQQAITCKFANEWNKAIEKEFDSHANHNTRDVVNYPQGKPNIMNTKWIFTIKIDNEGNEVAKARLVVVGCADKNQYIQTETFSPVCHVDTIQIVLSCAQKYNMKLAVMDVVTAYLYGKVSDDNIYLRIPASLNLDCSKLALKLNSAMYGLKISGKRWHDTFTKELTEMGFTRSNVDRCLFIKKKSDHTTSFLAVYVDDVLFCSNSEFDREQVPARLSKKF